MIGFIRRMPPLNSKRLMEINLLSNGNSYELKANDFFNAISRSKLNILYYMFNISEKEGSISQDISSLKDYVDAHVNDMDYLINQHSNPSKSRIIQDILYINGLDRMDPLSNQVNYNSIIKDLSKDTSFLNKLYSTSGIEESVKNKLVMNLSRIDSLEKQLSNHFRPSSSQS